MECAIAWVQILSAIVFPLVILVVFLNRKYTQKGIGVRIVQFTAAAMFIPGIVILATGNYIGGETSAALVGAFIGYLFSNISAFDDKK
ncbi:hypothetical protein AB2N04_16900 [Nitratireductor sp. GISD-1A_MAKvit]|uniref:hypothetical protein n=1 Tax=Nitratireductor sp. GISD-1A_MAKvit TaxID=3234198 RepID=UPI003465FC40